MFNNFFPENTSSAIYVIMLESMVESDRQRM